MRLLYGQHVTGTTLRVRAAAQYRPTSTSIYSHSAKASRAGVSRHFADDDNNHSSRGSNKDA